jgi:hypothetical protein
LTDNERADLPFRRTSIGRILSRCILYLFPAATVISLPSEEDERYAKGGENNDLKAFASKTLPTLQHHLMMAEDLRSNTSTQGRGNR